MQRFHARLYSNGEMSHLPNSLSHGSKDRSATTDSTSHLSMGLVYLCISTRTPHSLSEADAPAWVWRPRDPLDTRNLPKRLSPEANTLRLTLAKNVIHPAEILAQQLGEGRPPLDVLRLGL